MDSQLCVELLGRGLLEYDAALEVVAAAVGESSMYTHGAPLWFFGRRSASQKTTEGPHEEGTFFWIPPAVLRCGFNEFWQQPRQQRAS